MATLKRFCYATDSNPIENSVDILTNKGYKRLPDALRNHEPKKNKVLIIDTRLKHFWLACNTNLENAKYIVQTKFKDDISKLDINSLKTL